LPSFAIGLLLAAHGLVHASFLSPAPPVLANGWLPGETGL
jgi:hypothetical protein